MKFPLEVVDACSKIRDKLNKPEFTIGYRLSPEEPFDDGITMTETLTLIRALLKKPLQFIHVSQAKFFQEVRRGEGVGIPRLKVIHDAMEGKMTLIGVGGLLSDKDFNKALNSGYAEFIAAGKALMLNKDLGTLLKEGKELCIEFDGNHPEKYAIPKFLWDMFCQNTGWLPRVKKD